MQNTQHAHDLAKFLAPMLENVQDFSTEPGSPDSVSHLENAAGPAGPAVDFAILLELHEVWKKAQSLRNEAGERAADEFGDRLTEVLEGDEHAVGVLWALLAGGDDQLGTSAPHPPLASPPGAGTASGHGSPPGGRDPARDQRPPGDRGRSGDPPPKKVSTLRRAWVSICMNAIVVLVLGLAWWLAWP